MDIPAGNNIPDELRTIYGNYYVPRKMILVPHRTLNKIPCECPFCKPFSKINPQAMSSSEWNDLRIYHFLWIKNDEIRQLIEEGKKNSLRVALQSMFADSEKWKNFAEFVS